MGEMTNSQRATQARLALEAYSQIPDARSTDELVRDLVSDCWHYLRLSMQLDDAETDEHFRKAVAMAHMELSEDKDF